MSETYGVNGVEVTDIETLEEAMSHLKKEYNEGEIYLAEGGSVCCIKARSRTLRNYLTRMVQNHPNLRFSTISCKDGKSYVEIRNAE